MPTDSYARLCELFTRDTGMMAPGRDIAAAEGYVDSWEERYATFEAWQRWRLLPEATRGTWQEYTNPNHDLPEGK